MSNIVAFRPDRRSRSASSEPGAGAAQILFFTGIRYVRMSDAETGPESGEQGVLAGHADAALDLTVREPVERLKA